MPTKQPYDIVMIGNYTKDTITSPSGVLNVDGGAVNYAAHAAVRLGFHTAMVTRLAREDDRMIQKLVSAGVDCFPVYTPSSTIMKLDYPTTNPDIRTLYVSDTAGSITVDQIENIETRAAVIGTSLRGEAGLDVIKTLHARNILMALDVQGFVRVLENHTLVYKPWEEMSATLSHIDILKSDAVEAEFLTGEKDIYKAAKFYSNLGPSEVVLTHKDGLLVLAKGNTYEEKFFTSKLDGRSGRGDTCLGTYAAMRLRKSPATSAVWAAALTSLKMEKLGPFDRNLQDVEDFIRIKYAHAGI